MGQFLGFGNGQDGAATLSGTDAPIDSSCSGSSGATSLTATNASFATGQIILIHQSRGTGAGSWEINKIASYVAGTITTELPLANTYTDSGASQAQVLVVKQYTEVTISGTLTAKAWDGDVGGIIAFLSNSKVSGANNITADGKGFRGGARVDNQTGNQGEGTGGAGSQSTAANGNGGGGGQGADTNQVMGGGGGGGNTIAGSNGITITLTGGAGGLAIGNSALTTMVFGGGGGAGGDGDQAIGAGAGGAGGGIILIFCKEWAVTGSITQNGVNGSNTESGDRHGGGGGGGGGSVFIKAEIATLGSALITAIKGSGSISGAGANGGDGSNGAIRIEVCSRTGTTNPSASESIGGHDFCASNSAIL